MRQAYFYFIWEVSTMTDNANVKQERVSITAFISKDTRDKLLRIAEDEDLTFSALVRRALKEYADKKAI
jgi:hypothetical protein